MADLYLTDSRKNYQKSIQGNKILIGQSFFKIVEASTILSAAEIQSINESFMQRRLLRGDEILSDLASLASEIDLKGFPYPQKNKNPQLGMSHFLFRGMIEKKHQLVVLVEILLESREWSEIEMELTEQFSKVDETIADRKVKINRIEGDLKKQIQKQGIKNRLYFLFDVKRKFSPIKFPENGKKRLVFLIHTASHHHELIQDLYLKIHHSADLEIILVTYPLALGDPNAYRKFLPDGICEIPIQAFRGRTKFNLSNTVIDKLKSINYSSVHTNYTMFHNMVEVLKPDMCVTIGYQEPSKYLTDVCRYLGVPSTVIDYSFITDDYTFEKHLEFDWKCTISKSQQQLWKKRNDPTHGFEVTGFLKYDRASTAYDKVAFYEKYDLNPALDSVLFASSHGYDPTVKEEILIQLGQLCTARNWNLIVKTHPLETDGIAKRVISAANQVTLLHEEVSSMEAVFQSDVVVSQGSSIVLDALYYYRPFVTFSFSEDLVITDFMPISKEEFVFKANDIATLESILERVFDNKDKYISKMEKVRGKYLFETDNKATERVFNFLRSKI